MGSGASTRREVEEWGPDDVKQYISSLGEDFLPIFENKKLDGQALLQCGNKELLELGVDATHRHKLLGEKVKHLARWRHHDLDGTLK